MSELNEKLQEIKRQKDEYILSSNLKAGTKVFDINGAFVGQTNGIVEYETIEALLEDNTQKLNTVGVVINTHPETLDNSKFIKNTDTSSYNHVPFNIDHKDFLIPSVIELPITLSSTDNTGYTSFSIDFNTYCVVNVYKEYNYDVSPAEWTGRWRMTFEQNMHTTLFDSMYSTDGKTFIGNTNNIWLRDSQFAQNGPSMYVYKDNSQLQPGTNQEDYDLYVSIFKAIFTDIGYDIAKAYSWNGTNWVDELGVSGVKLFETEEQMQQDETAKEGDLAVVYRSEVKNATVDSKFQVATFPETVVLDTALTDSVEVRYRAVDSSKMFDCWGSLDSSRFSMNCYTETEEVRIEYTSSDGITYTRTDTTGNPVDFGTEIYYERAEYWNDVLGKFIKCTGSIFDGLYECKSTVVTDTYVLKGIKYHLPEFSINLFNSEIRYEHACVVLNTVTDGNEVTDYTIYNLYNDGTKFYLDGNNLMSNNTNAGTSANIVKLHYTNGETKREVLPSTSGSASAPTSINLGETYNAEITVFINCDLYSNISASNVLVNSDDTFSKVYSLTYNIAPTQLSAIADYVYGKEFYGKNGVETGTLVQNVSNSFADINAEIVYKIQNQYENMEPRVLTNSSSTTLNPNIYFIPVKKDGTVLLDTSNVTTMGYMFGNCKNLITIPLLDTSNVTNMNGMFSFCANLITIPLLDTSKVTNMNSMFLGCTNLITIPLLNTSNVTDIKAMFYGCTNLQTIPLLDTSKVTDMKEMFLNCTSLSDESLNNILAMCISATSYTGTKTLKYISLTSAQANKCKTLSNYSAFTAAGWTTGY